MQRNLLKKNNVFRYTSPIPTGLLQGSAGVSDTWVETIRNGLPMNAFYTRKFLGIDKSTGAFNLMRMTEILFIM